MCLFTCGFVYQIFSLPAECTLCERAARVFGWPDGGGSVAAPSIRGCGGFSFCRTNDHCPHRAIPEHQKWQEIAGSGSFSVPFPHTGETAPANAQVRRPSVRPHISRAGKTAQTSQKLPLLGAALGTPDSPLWPGRRGSGLVRVLSAGIRLGEVRLAAFRLGGAAFGRKLPWCGGFGGFPAWCGAGCLTKTVSR